MLIVYTLSYLSSVLVYFVLSFAFTLNCYKGCPLSPLLYVLGAEILARAIRENKKIKGLGIPTGKNQRFKISQFADDTALGVESEDEINEVEKTIQHFEKESGARLNRENVCHGTRRVEQKRLNGSVV